MDGGCNSYNEYKGELVFMRMSKRYMIHLSIAGGIRRYDETHPIFEKEKEETICKAMGMFFWRKPFGFERFSFNFGGDYEKTYSNIDFYDSDEILTFMTLGFHLGDSGHDDN